MTEPVAETVVRHLRAGRDGALATISAHASIEGFPFGSVVPYALDGAGRPLLFLSDIAQHTRNLMADPRASLLVRGEADGDAQATWRVTLVGRMEQHESAEDLARYVAVVPDAESYRETHGFALWRMEIERIRFIGGFGNIHWVEPADFASACA